MNLSYTQNCFVRVLKISKIKKLTVTLVSIIVAICFSGCITETINTFDSFTIQVPIEVSLVQRGNMDTTIRIENLNDYPEYRNNRERIKDIILYQSAFWIDTLDPFSLDEGFTSLDYYFEIGPKKYLIASYNNITIRDFLRKPHIDQVPDSVAREISDKLKIEEHFTTYLVIKRKPGSTTNFNFINVNVVVDVRIVVNL